MEVSWKVKVEEFCRLMKQKGYKVKINEESMDPFDYRLEHIVSKDDYYHVSVSEKMIIEAPIEYSVQLVEEEFKRLEGRK